MSIEQARDQLARFIHSYEHLTEEEKFALGRYFHEATGGKLSPYNSPSPVVVALVGVDGPDGPVGFLGVRRAVAPCAGGIALPGGFLSPNEDPAAGLAREVLEETGIHIDPHGFAPDCQPHMAQGNNLLMFFATGQRISLEDIAQANDTLANADGEASELVVIDSQTELCFPLHQAAIDRALARGRG